MTGIPAPIYRCVGRLVPGESQVILQMVETKGFANGPLRLGAMYFQELPGTKSNEASVEIQLTTQTIGEGLLDRRLFAKVVRLFHNYFGKNRRSTSLPAMVRKILESQGQTIEAEYALYAGVLQGISTNATDEDRALAKEAATAFFERFPESWLRAHTYAALILIARYEGNEAEAQQLLEKGLQLPESNPLFYNVGILPEPGEAPSEQTKPEEGGKP